MNIGLFHGVGKNSGGIHKVFEGGKHTTAYIIWRNMLMRCYSEKNHKRHPSYIECSVDERFHDFQDFAGWYYNHDYSNLGYELDKDLLIPNNKIYSPDNCCFVPQELNKLLTSRGRCRGKLPQGVCFHSRVKKYNAQVWISGKRKHLGYFDCPDEAHQVYREAKERYVKNKALEWANRIEWNVFVALMAWKLNN